MGTKSMIIAERSSLEGTRGRLDTCVIVVKLQMQTRAIQTQMRNNTAFFALHRSRSSGSYELLVREYRICIDLRHRQRYRHHHTVTTSRTATTAPATTKKTPLPFFSSVFFFFVTFLKVLKYQDAMGVAAKQSYMRRLPGIFDARTASPSTVVQ